MLRFLSFGTHPRLSLAEFRAIKPDLAPPTTVGACAIVDDADWDGEALMERLGGTVKLGDVIGTMETERLDGIQIAEMILQGGRMKGEGGSDPADARLPDGQATTQRSLGSARDRLHDAMSIDFGLTIVGGSGSAARTKRIAMEVKRKLKERGIRSRWVTSDESKELSPAAVAKLKLTSKGADIVVVVDGETAHIGKTTRVQDADAWSERDYGRPARDDRAGMLPPKLARMMVNLARIPDGATLLDPFCGNGTILMEAALASGAKAMIGGDIDTKQVATTEKNNQWLTTRGIVTRDAASGFKTFTCDARRVSTKLPNASVDVIVTEGTLGPPLRGHESQSAIEKTKRDIEDLWRASLQDWKAILKPNGRIVGVWPSFKTDKGLARVGLDDEIRKIGYRILNPLEGWDDSNAPLVYHRQGQRVARRIVVMER